MVAVQVSPVVVDGLSMMEVLRVGVATAIPTRAKKAAKKVRVGCIAGGENGVC